MMSFHPGHPATPVATSPSAAPPTPMPSPPNPEADPLVQRPKVVYVMGAGKSGSTIFGVALGNCDGFVYTGELFTWMVRSGLPVFSGSELAEFWEKVRQQVDAAGLFGNNAARRLERSRSLLRVDQWPARRRLRPRFRRVSEDLYRAIARVANATHIVDTSHFPMRARELRAISGIDLYLVFLIRDPRSVVASYTRHIQARPLRRGLAILRSNADLWFTYLLSLFVFLTHRRDRRMLVRHEQFLADPEGTIREILDRTGSRSAIPDLTALRTGYPLQSNVLVRSPMVALRPHTEPPSNRSLMTTVLQLPWALILPRLRPVVPGASSDADTRGH
jgi:Sulfotransferase family